MRVDAVLIQQPAIDFATFLGLTHEALGYSPAARSDASGRQLSDAERFLSCLEALHDPHAQPALRPHLLNHVSFSVLIAAEDQDAIAIVEVASGMPWVRTETRLRGLELIVVTGTLAQWRDAVISGTNKDGNVQACYCKILTLFEQAGLNVWLHCTKKPNPANRSLFLLQDKRGH